MANYSRIPPPNPTSLFCKKHLIFGKCFLMFMWLFIMLVSWPDNSLALLQDFKKSIHKKSCPSAFKQSNNKNKKKINYSVWNLFSSILAILSRLTKRKQNISKRIISNKWLLTALFIYFFQKKSRHIPFFTKIVFFVTLIYSFSDKAPFAMVHYVLLR